MTKLMQSVLLEVQYLPSVAYFAAFQGAPVVILEKHEHYTKQSFRNRCQIVSANGVLDLTVPTTGKHGKISIAEIRIDYDQKWLSNHWRTIQSAYGKAPFFEHYQEDLKTVLFKKVSFLYDLNYELLSMCLKWMKQDVTIRETSTYEKDAENGVLDLRSAINPKNVAKLREFYTPVPYYQVFGNTFAGNVSIIDLIFCEGPGAAQIVRASSTAK